MFCQLLARFEVPSEEAQLTEQFNLWFYKHEIGDSITVGTQAEIRTRIHCLFCRFVQSVIVARESAGCDDSALCVAKLAGGGGFRLDMSFPSERSVMPLGERFLFVGASAQAGAECGRLVDPNGLDYGMIRNWLAICERLHQDVCPIPDRWKTRQMRAPSRLRVMDVLENCLVDIPWQWKYVALSYVWGSAQPPKLIKAELPSLMRPGALANIRSNAPRTIQDVMDFTSRMGIQYLWFDSLCLVQDDPGDLDRGIRNMDIVYESAYFTLIAASGPGADSGLHGVRRASRGSRQDLISVKPGLDMLRVKSLDEHLGNSVWASRGWT
jgi:hypothetical protein